MALRQTGLADDIINLAFGLTLGAAAVAFALASAWRTRHRSRHWRPAASTTKSAEA